MTVRELFNGLSQLFFADIVAYLIHKIYLCINIKSLTSTFKDKNNKKQRDNERDNQKFKLGQG